MDRRLVLVRDRAGRRGRAATSLATRACTLSLATHEFDLVVDGEAELVTDPPTVAALAAELGRRRAGPARSTRAASRSPPPFSAPSAGPPPWHVYRIVARSAALATVEPGGATASSL